MPSIEPIYAGCLWFDLASGILYGKSLSHLSIYKRQLSTHYALFIAKIMLTPMSEHLPTGSLPYELITPEQRAKAAVHIHQLLQHKLVLLTHHDWLAILDEFKPTIRVEAEGTVTVAAEMLASLTSWAILYQATRYEFLNERANDLVQLGNDAYYLSRHIQAYSKQAKVLLAADPKLVDTLSVDQMRDIIHRLAVGNTVAERRAESRPHRIAATK
jgi:hypothetical protein